MEKSGRVRTKPTTIASTSLKLGARELRYPSIWTSHLPLKLDSSTKVHGSSSSSGQTEASLASLDVRIQTRAKSSQRWIFCGRRRRVGTQTRTFIRLATLRTRRRD